MFQKGLNRWLNVPFCFKNEVKGNMQLTNYMEKIVVDRLDTVLGMFPDACTCDECKQDIANLALNHLPPKYTSSDKGAIFLNMEAQNKQYDAMVVQEIVKSIGIISQNPRHPKKQ